MRTPRRAQSRHYPGAQGPVAYGIGLLLTRRQYSGRTTGNRRRRLNGVHVSTAKRRSLYSQKHGISPPLRPADVRQRVCRRETEEYRHPPSCVRPTSGQIAPWGRKAAHIPQPTGRFSLQIPQNPACWAVHQCPADRGAVPSRGPRRRLGPPNVSEAGTPSSGSRSG